MDAANYPYISIVLAVVILIGISISMFSYIYGKNIRSSNNENGYRKKSYALLSELNDVVEPEYMNINEI